eukprot:SAG31_NODE_2422_length_5726_cov_2.047450_2_plen_58_part_00
MLPAPRPRARPLAARLRRAAASTLARRDATPAHSAERDAQTDLRLLCAARGPVRQAR